MGPPLGGPCFYMMAGLSAAPDGTPLRVPTLAEPLRVKAWLALTRNYGRDHIDTAAPADARGGDKGRARPPGLRRMLRRVRRLEPQSAERAFAIAVVPLYSCVSPCLRQR